MSASSGRDIIGHAADWEVSVYPLDVVSSHLFPVIQNCKYVERVPQKMHLIFEQVDFMLDMVAAFDWD